MHVSQIHSSNSLLLFVFLQRGKVVETKVVPCGRSGLTSKSDIFHTNMQINGPKSVHMQNYGRATITKILNYTGSRGVKLSQKVFFFGGGGYFFDSHCILLTVAATTAAALCPLTALTTPAMK